MTLSAHMDARPQESLRCLVIICSMISVDSPIELGLHILDPDKGL